MWKMLVAFIIFAAIALTVVFKAGEKVDMQGVAGGHAEQTEAKGDAPAAPAATDTAVPESYKK